MEDKFKGNSTAHNNTINNYIHVAPSSWNSTSGTTTTTSFDCYGDQILVDVLIKETTIEVIYKRVSQITYTTTLAYHSSPPDKVWKEVYGVKDDKLALLKTIHGTHIKEQYIPESYDFDEEE